MLEPHRSYDLSLPEIRSGNSPQRPLISIIVCTRNRADSLARTLNLVQALDVADVRAVELVVVDNASTDHTQKVLEVAAAKARFALRSVFEAHLGLSFARNAGIGAARGDLIVFTDDDCLVPADWIQQVWTLFGKNLRQLIGGQVLLHNPVHLSLSIRTESTPERLEHPRQALGFLLGANMAFGRCVFNEIGGFDTNFGAGTALRAGEDTEFVYRAYIHGIPVRYEPSFTVRHDHGRTKPRELARLTWGYAIGTGAVVAKYVIAGRRDLLKPLYWDIRSAARNLILRPSSWRQFAARGGFLVGAVRYLQAHRKMGVARE